MCIVHVHVDERERGEKEVKEKFSFFLCRIVMLLKRRERLME